MSKAAVFSMKSFLPFIVLIAFLQTAPTEAAEGPATPQLARAQLPAYQTVRLENGLTLFLLPRHQLPLISFQWLLKSGGSIGDPVGKEGLAAVTAELLRKGTAGRTADQISEALDFVGASFQTSPGHEYTTGSAEFVAKDLDLALELLSDMLLHPAFPEDEVSKLIKQRFDGIKEAKDVPNEVIGRYYDALLFGRHPYARPISGTENSLTNITREDVATFYRNHYVPNNLLLAVVGDFSSTELEAKLRARFGAWSRKSVTVAEAKPAAKINGRQVLLVDKPDATQTFFRFGNIGLARTNSDWVVVRVVNTLFGGRFTSMVNSALRIESGLTYGAGSSFTPGLAPGSFAIASYTPNDSSERAINLALEVLRKLHETGLTAEQLQSAKTYLKGQFGPTLETNDQLADQISELEFYGLGPQEINTLFDRIDSVTLGDAKRIIETYYPRNDLAFVFIGQAAVIEPVAQKLGAEVRKKSINDPGF
jgi:predicted Zn-dependent peptidase